MIPLLKYENSLSGNSFHKYLCHTLRVKIIVEQVFVVASYQN